MTGPLALGNALHYTLEQEHKANDWNLDRACQVFLKDFRDAVEKDEIFITWPKMKKSEAEGIEMLELFDYGIRTGKIPTIPFEAEKEFKLPFEDEIVVVGKIDRIDRDEDGYIITDYKSGSVAPDEWFLRHDLQLTCYAWACLELYGELPKKVVWHHLRKGQLIETERTMSDIDDLKTMLHNAIAMNKQEIRYRVFHQQICKWCDFAGHGNECEDKELEAQLVEQRKQLNGVV